MSAFVEKALKKCYDRPCANAPAKRADAKQNSHDCEKTATATEKGCKMKQSKFTLNAFLLIILIFSVMAFFFTVFLSGMAGVAFSPHVNDSYDIEDTDLFILYSDKKPSGIYEGDPVNGQLKVKGTFGHDWGIALEDDYLYLNEYRTSTFGMTYCNLIRINVHTFEKEDLMRDTILRGQCTSGELVCVSDILMPSMQPKTNAFCRLYAITAPGIDPKSDEGTILIIDPADTKILYQTSDEEALTEAFEERYLNHSLDELQKGDTQKEDVSE